MRHGRTEAPKAHTAIASVVVAVSVATADHARAAPEVGQDDGSPPQGRSGLPGEYPQHRYRSSFPSPNTEEEADFEDKYLTGDWLGARSNLADHGVTVTALFISDAFGNVVGGRRRGFADYNLVAGDLLLDTDKLFGLAGGEFHAGVAGNFGVRLSRSFVGNGFPVQLADVADTNARLTYLSYTQSLFDDRLSIRVGRLTINSVYGEEFLGSEYFKAFTSVGIDLVPLGLFLNAPGAFGYPDTTWGARVKVEPVQQFYAMVGAYNGDPRLKDGTRHGVDFSMRGPLFLIGEMGVRRNYGKDADGLSGNLKLGSYYDAARYGFYVVGDHELLRFGESKQGRHLGAFGALTFTPNRDANVVPVFFDAGLVLYGPASGRPKDSVGFAVAYGYYRTASFEMTLEWTYGLRLVSGLLLQPDVQYILHPRGEVAIPNALAIGLNVVVNL
jgi:porin